MAVTDNRRPLARTLPAGHGRGNIEPMSLAPALLLSMPQLIDRNFARSVVLDDKED
jgi:hypothetical protein